jgi:cell division protein FtsB
MMARWLKFVLAAAGIVGILIIFSLVQEMNRRLSVQREIVRLESEASKLEKNLIQMENLNQYFKTNDFAELMAREKLNYRAEGEKVVLIPETAAVQDEGDEADQVDARSIPKRWWDAFFTKPLAR